MMLRTAAIRYQPAAGQHGKAKHSRSMDAGSTATPLPGKAAADAHP